MSCCCEKQYRFCNSVSVCTTDGFKDLFKNLTDGAYNIKLDFLDKTLVIPITVAGKVVTVTDELVTGLNERYTFTGKVINASGDVVPLTVGEETYDCFEFTTTN